MKSVVKLALWLIIGIGSTGALVGTTEFNTPWRYTVESHLAPGTKITLTQPDGSPTVMEVGEGQTISGRETFDIGAPATLFGAYLLGSIMAFGLKSKRRVEMP